MAELTLEPYAAVQRWRAAEADGRWEAMLADYLRTLARRCAAAGPCVIGHIKALALFSEERFFRVSVVSADIPATTEGEVPAGCTDLELTLNVLVYGLEGAAIERMTGETADDIARRWKRTVRHEETQHAHHHVHTSHPPCSQGGYDE